MTLARLIHLAECAFLLLLAGLAVWRLYPAVPQHPQLVIFLIAELLGVVLIVIQRPGDVATGLKPVLLGFSGTGVALLIVPNGVQLAPDFVSTVLVVGGVTLSILAKLSLRRSFGLVAANRGVKEGGLYKLVRHPMYMAYIVNHIGYLMLYLSAWNVAIYVLTWILLWMRTDEEERVLRTDPAYCAYASRVRSRLVPGLI
ncbi:protein-S-isoprenylcysteine O-methyltransferase Ste14 [Novosphingobium sp. PhB165]|uniref:methyltransferase family protein n=1 Tax=Novosphingobium sp. PhB165 TaxID=2485105 RepID=UPI001053DE01|nr:isoprenylcysteine carboxylmethyltransferase family protein [Novosphingobium sp. PhB165]TCM21543.1 protein-S-isoprenylcysteine O-methyltransferase Ste14 [Novosphingobium sp. PhB165]